MDFARIAYRLAVAGTALQLAGCSNLSGLGGGAEFQCKAPEGIPCQSISGVHHNERAGNLPAQRAALGGAPIKSDAGTASGAASALSQAPGEGAAARVETAATAAQMPVYRKALAGNADQVAGLGAIRSEPTVIRIWVAPWEDADGDLNDQSYVYLQIDSGRWLIEHNRAQIRREFAPQRAVPVAVGLPADAAQPRPAAQAPVATPAVAATPAAPAPVAKMLTKEEAIALGKAQAQAQAQAQALKAAKPADATAATAVRP
ncbi:MAG: type IV conjugative transfer system protein TraV [Burkholderiales bacterium PBB5]|nr:MAG: type IV conjugative transfer system protein TraV [Burkholderiales bacterium PBB5]